MILKKLEIANRIKVIPIAINAYFKSFKANNKIITPNKIVINKLCVKYVDI